MSILTVSQLRQWSIIFVVFAAALSYARPVRFDFKDAGMRNLVEASSEMPFERVVGLSNFIGGWIELDTERLAGPVRGEFEVDLRTFQTGIDARDELLREKVLNVAEFPKAIFVLEKFTKFSKPVLADGHTVHGRWEGTLKVRGVTKPQSMLVKLTYFRENEKTKQRAMGNLLKVDTSFDLDTSAFGFLIPETFRFQLSKFLQLSVDVIGTDRLPSVLPPRAEASTRPTPAVAKPTRK